MTGTLHIYPRYNSGREFKSLLTTLNISPSILGKQDKELTMPLSAGYKLLELNALIVSKR